MWRSESNKSGSDVKKRIMAVEERKKEKWKIYGMNVNLMYHEMIKT